MIAKTRTRSALGPSLLVMALLLPPAGCVRYIGDDAPSDASSARVDALADNGDSADVAQTRDDAGDGQDGYDDAGADLAALLDTVRDGFTVDAMVDGPATDRRVDTLSADGTVDSGPLFDGSNLQLLFQLQTDAVGIFDTFNCEISKAGQPLHWDLGDGTTLDGNIARYHYAQGSVKTVSVYSSDGGDGITSISCVVSYLVGPLPPELGRLPNLTGLYFNGNQLRGSIPPELGSLSQLRSLLLDENAFTGPIPAELGQLANLHTLHLSSNQLSGPIPPQLGQATQLSSLMLHYNALDGTIPTELGQMTSLMFLNLRDNQLTGTIPAVLSNLTELRSVRATGNQLSGYAAGAMVGPRQINSLWFDANNLSQAAIDALVNDIYQERQRIGSQENKTLSLEGGTNATPGATALTQIAELRARFSWTIRCNGC